MILRSIFFLGLVSTGAAQLPHFDAASIPALPKVAIQSQADGALQKAALIRLNDMKAEFKATDNNIMVGDKADLNRVATIVRSSIEAR